MQKLKTSITAIVKGGVGNQLFIYAAARALALRTNRDLILDPLIGFHKDPYGRLYKLDRFNIKAKHSSSTNTIAPSLRHPRHKIIRALNKCLPRNQRNYIAERSSLDSNQLQTLEPHCQNLIINGYWQDETYFSAYAPIIRKELQPPLPEDQRNLQLGEQIRGCESVCLHIRRVRYERRLGADYYQAAIDRVLAETKRPHFFIFGDALEWPGKHLNFHSAPICMVHENKDNELADLWLISQCKHRIIANSSFSWWGAWLPEKSTEGIVFCSRNTGWPLKNANNWSLIDNQIEAN